MGEGILQSLGGIIFSLTVAAKTFFQALGILPAPCEQPIEYTIGVVDDRFGITEAEVLQAVKAAEDIWESGSGKNLFEYNKEEGLPVQFVYDERQQRTQASKDLQEKLNTLGVEENEDEVKKRIAEYEQAKVQYEKAVASYEGAADAYNAKVKKINNSGGATPKQEEELQDEYRDIQKQFQQLEQLRQKVNSLATVANQHIATNHSLVETYNRQVTTFQERYGGEGDVFDQGMYTGSDITIYQYDDQARLVLVLAHEMGHALGLEHVEAPEALMYYLMRDQDVTTLKLNDADKQALENICQAPKFGWQR